MIHHELSMLPLGAFRPVGRKMTLHFGGGSTPDQSGMNEAAKMNAQIAQDMWNEYKTTYLPKETQFVSDSFNYDTPSREAQQVGIANSDVQRAIANTQGQTNRQMASMGINPNSGRFASINADNQVQNAATLANAENQARLNTQNTGYQREANAISLGKGLPTQASGAASGAATAYGQAANTQLAQNQQQAQNVGSAVGGAYMLGHALNYYKDGGMVRRYAKGGLVMASKQPRKGMKPGLSDSQSIWNQPEQGMAEGGMPMNPMMWQLTHNMPAQTAPQAPQPSPAAQLAPTAIKMSLYHQNPGGTGLNSPLVQGIKKGLSNMFTPTQPTAPAIADASTTAEAGGASMGVTPPTAGLADTAAAGGGSLGFGAAAPAVADAATTAAAGGGSLFGAGAAGAGAAAPGLAALGPIGLAIGAGLLANELFKKDGGEVTDKELIQVRAHTRKRKDMRKGGPIKGPGTTTSDSVPIMASNKEYMLNAEATKMVGKAKLDKINQAGLKKRYGLANARRAA